MKEFNPDDKGELRGGYLNMPDAVYHATQGFVSSSGLRDILRSPAHYYYKDQSDRTRNMEIGSAIHTRILEPEVFAKKYMVVEGAADRRASVYKEASAVHGPEFTLTRDEGVLVNTMAANFSLNPEAERLIKAAEHKEISVFTKDPVTGVGVRIRLDALARLDGQVIGMDYKSTTDAREFAFSRSINDYGYHIQAALYMSAWEWEYGEKIDSFLLLPQEKTQPYTTEVYQLDDISLSIGKKLMREALNKYAECLSSGVWSNYEGHGQRRLITLPDWVISNFEDENGLIIG